LSAFTRRLRRDRLVCSSRSTSLLGELIEEGVVAFVGGPDGHVVAPGDAALGGFPEEARVGVFGKFVEADVAAVNGHGLRVGGEGDDARAVIEFDDANFDVFGETGWPAMMVEAINGEIFFAVTGNRAGEVKNLGELVALADVFESAGIIFGGKQIITVLKPEAFANVFEGVGVGPADANGFFGESDGLPALVVDGFFGLNPGDLVRQKMFGEAGVGVEFG